MKSKTRTPKFNLQKGDMIIARTAAIHDENPPYGKIGGHVEFEKPITVVKTFSHGVRTKQYGYVHNNNILKKLKHL